MSVLSALLLVVPRGPSVLVAAPALFCSSPPRPSVVSGWWADALRASLCHLAALTPGLQWKWPRLLAARCCRWQTVSVADGKPCQVSSGRAARGPPPPALGSSPVGPASREGALWPCCRELPLPSRPQRLFHSRHDSLSFQMQSPLPCVRGLSTAWGDLRLLLPPVQCCRAQGKR